MNTHVALSALKTAVAECLAAMGITAEQCVDKDALLAMVHAHVPAWDIDRCELICSAQTDIDEILHQAEPRTLEAWRLRAAAAVTLEIFALHGPQFAPYIGKRFLGQFGDYDLYVTPDLSAVIRVLGAPGGEQVPVTSDGLEPWAVEALIRAYDPPVLTA